MVIEETADDWEWAPMKEASSLPLAGAAKWGASFDGAGIGARPSLSSYGYVYWTTAGIAEEALVWAALPAMAASNSGGIPLSAGAAAAGAPPSAGAAAAGAGAGGSGGLLIDC